MELNEFLDKAYAVLRRLDAVLPPEPGHTDWNALAFRWQSAGKKGFLAKKVFWNTCPIRTPSPWQGWRELAGKPNCWCVIPNNSLPADPRITY